MATRPIAPCSAVVYVGSPTQIWSLGDLFMLDDEAGRAHTSVRLTVPVLLYQLNAFRAVPSLSVFRGAQLPRVSFSVLPAADGGTCNRGRAELFPLRCLLTRIDCKGGA